MSSDKRERTSQRPVGASVPTQVVDAGEPTAATAPIMTDRVESGDRRPVTVASVAMLSAGNLRRAESAVSDFARGSGTDAGERLLQELVAGEVGVALQLVDVEAGLAMLLARTIDDPRLALEVAKVFRETTALSAAVRRRMENCLSAASTLRAQRLLTGGSFDDV